MSCLKYSHLKTYEMGDTAVGSTLFQKDSVSGFPLGLPFDLPYAKRELVGRAKPLNHEGTIVCYLFNSGSLKPQELSVLYSRVYSVRVRKWGIFRNLLLHTYSLNLLVFDFFSN